MKIKTINFDSIKLITFILLIYGYSTDRVSDFMAILIFLLLIKFKIEWKV